MYIEEFCYKLTCLLVVQTRCVLHFTWAVHLVDLSLCLWQGVIEGASVILWLLIAIHQFRG